MNMKYKSVLSALLAAALLAASLTSCSEKTPDSPADAPADAAAQETSGEAAAESAEPETVTDDLGSYSFDGAAFGMMTFENQNFHYETLVEESTGETLNDAMFDATLRIEDRFNVDLTQILYADFADTPKVSVTAGDTSLDVVRLRCDTATTWWKDNLLIPADNVPKIDLSKPYWDKMMNESLTIAGTHYVAMSAFDLPCYDLTFALCFNKQLIGDHNLDNPYELVTNGVWTIDKMNDMMLTVVSDADGNGSWDENDVYGYLASPKMVAPGFWIGAGLRSIDKDENDIPYLNITSEPFIDLWVKILNITYGEHQRYGYDDGPDIPTNCRQMFAENKGLFMDMSFFFAGELRSMESDFGIIPYPKADEAQSSYRCRLCYYIPTVVPITKTGEELERCGVLLEALGCEYYNSVVPAYYDIVLQNKVMRDEDSRGMLDIIFESRVIDIGDSTMCGDLRDGMIRQMYEANDPDLVSKSKSVSKVIEKKLSQLPGVEG